MIPVMCNDYEQHVRHADYQAMLQTVSLTAAAHESELDLPQADDIRIGDTGPVMRLSADKKDEVELSLMTFGFPPQGKSGPVFNFRSEGRNFADSKRCLIPASAFFEFTGKKYPKAKHRFTMTGQPFFAIAGLWREGHGNHPASFTMLTTAPGPDVAPIHDRQIVVLPPDSWKDWLLLSKPESEMLRALPEGSLQVKEVRASSD